MIEVKELTKQYGDKKALDSVSFSVREGEIVGFLGPNGAGKSTTMNILTGYISSTSGSASVGGFDILEEPLKAKAQIGYLPEIPPLYPDMTVMEYLDFIYDLKKCSLPRDEHISAVLKQVKIEDAAGRIIKNLSKGYKQRVGIAQALIGNPPILILDEPTVGLDPNQIIEIRGLIKELGEKHTVILSSHILSEVQAVCGRIIIISHGKIAADDTAEGLSRSVGESGGITVGARASSGALKKVLDGIKGARSVSPLPEAEEGIARFRVIPEKDADIRTDISGAVVRAGLPLTELSSARMTLEDIFLKVTEEPAAAVDKNGGEE